jgi:dinuclear metal center YbgI/SA1388 family protein
MNRDQIVEFCNGTLALHKHPDYGPMGLQFPGAENVTGVAAAVSVNLDVIRQAKERGHNLLIVHHGLFWNNESRLDSPWEARMNALEDAGITLLAYHLALDAHRKIGNNILLARNLGLGKLTPWEEIGWSGVYKEPMHTSVFYQKASKKLDGADATVFYRSDPFEVHKVAVIAGGAAQYIIQAKRDGFDTFVTGEPQEPSFNLARDLNMNFFAFGHDKTERSGVQALARLVSKKFHIPWDFIAQDNPV